MNCRSNIRVGNDKEMLMDGEQTFGILGELGRDECLELLAGREVGRVAVVVEGQPMIFPVNYALDGDMIVFRTGAGTKLEHGSFDRVAFEVDEIDPVHHEGWSVVVAGMAREITDALDSSSVREQSLPLQPWTGGPKEHLIRVISPAITGRRLRHSGTSPERSDGSSIVKLELTHEQAADLQDVLAAWLGDTSSEIADTDNPRFREALMKRRDNLANVAAHVSRAAEVDEARATVSTPVE